MAMIKLTGINKIYRTNEIETLALENVNLDVAKGEFVSIMGPSGCGKSTLLNIMGLLDAPSSGKIDLNRHDPTLLLPDGYAPWQPSFYRAKATPHCQSHSAN